jgi:hypothetical protein
VAGFGVFPREFHFLIHGKAELTIAFGEFRQMGRARRLPEIYRTEPTRRLGGAIVHNISAGASDKIPAQAMPSNDEQAQEHACSRETNSWN